MEKIGKSSKYLQKATITLDAATNVFMSLDEFIINLRDKFDNLEWPKDLSQRTKSRNSCQTFLDGSEPSVHLYGRDKFKI